MAMARPRIPTIPRQDDQLALDEQVIEDHDIEAALEARQSAKDERSAAQAAFKVAHNKASAELTKLELPVGGAARVGRFRITRTEVAARSVAFETEASDRVQIALIEG